MLNPSDRSVSGASNAKIGTQSGYEFELQKSEKRTKNAVPNKRTRTSMVDLKVCIFHLQFYNLLHPCFLILFIFL